MQIELAEWGEWSAAVESVAQYGSVDGRQFALAFAGPALAELFGLPEDWLVLETAFMRNQEFMNEITRDVVEAGRLREDGTLILYKEDLRPYFERRAATAPA